MSRITRRGLFGSALFTFALALGACDDDPTKVQDDMLTDAEVTSLVVGVGLLTTFEASDSLSSTAPCPLGGEVEFYGTAVLDSTGQVITLNTTLVPRGCRFQAQGREFTLDGNPSLRQQAVVDASDIFNVTVDGTVEGRVRWQLADRSGACDVDVTVDGQVALDSGDGTSQLTGKLTGMVCAREVNLRLEDLPQA